MAQINIKTSRIFGFGLLLLIIWNLVLFLLSVVFRFDTEIPLLPALILSLVMAIIAWSFLKIVRPISLVEAFVYSISWTCFVYIVILVIAIANGTTAVVFGNCIIYFAIILMAASPLIGKRSWSKQRSI